VREERGLSSATSAAEAAEETLPQPEAAELRKRALFLSLPPKCCKTNRLLLDDAALAGYSHQVFELQDP